MKRSVDTGIHAEAVQVLLVKVPSQERQPDEAKMNAVYGRTAICVVPWRIRGHEVSRWFCGRLFGSARRVVLKIQWSGFERCIELGVHARTESTVVLHVLPYSWKLNVERHTNLLEHIAPTDTRQLQDLRCLQRTVVRSAVGDTRFCMETNPADSTTSFFTNAWCVSPLYTNSTPVAARSSTAVLGLPLKITLAPVASVRTYILAFQTS